MTERSIPKINFPIIKTAAVMNTTPIRLKTRPARAISEMRILSVPKTMAFGGVATGNIKAKEQDRVPGIIRKRGFIFKETASAASMGRRISAVAVFEVSSVKKVMNMQIQATINRGGNEPSPSRN